MDWEQLRDRRAMLDHGRSLGWGPEVQRQEAELDAIEREMRWYASQRDKLIALATDGRAAMNVWTVELDRFGDHGQRLRTFKAELLRRELVPPEAAQIETQYHDPEKARLARERWQESQALDKAMTAILDAVGPQNKSAALAVYNRREEPRSWDRLNSWCRELVDERLLPVTWLPGAKGGLILEQLRRKMLGGRLANKMGAGPELNK